jgi:hypothetical protein
MRGTELQADRSQQAVIPMSVSVALDENLSVAEGGLVRLGSPSGGHLQGALDSGPPLRYDNHDINTTESQE